MQRLGTRVRQIANRRNGTERLDFDGLVELTGRVAAGDAEAMGILLSDRKLLERLGNGAAEAANGLADANDRLKEAEEASSAACAALGSAESAAADAGNRFDESESVYAKVEDAHARCAGSLAAASAAADGKLKRELAEVAGEVANVSLDDALRLAKGRAEHLYTVEAELSAAESELSAAKAARDMEAETAAYSGALEAYTEATERALEARAALVERSWYAVDSYGVSDGDGHAAWRRLADEEARLKAALSENNRDIGQEKWQIARIAEADLPDAAKEIRNEAHFARLRQLEERRARLAGERSALFEERGILVKEGIAGFSKITAMREESRAVVMDEMGAIALGSTVDAKTQKLVMEYSASVKEMRRIENQLNEMGMAYLSAASALKRKGAEGLPSGIAELRREMTLLVRASENGLFEAFNSDGSTERFAARMLEIARERQSLGIMHSRLAAGPAHGSLEAAQERLGAAAPRYEAALARAVQEAGTAFGAAAAKDALLDCARAMDAAACKIESAASGLRRKTGRSERNYASLTWRDALLRERNERAVELSQAKARADASAEMAIGAGLMVESLSAERARLIGSIREAARSLNASLVEGMAAISANGAGTADEVRQGFVAKVRSLEIRRSATAGGAEAVAYGEGEMSRARFALEKLKPHLAAAGLLAMSTIGISFVGGAARLGVVDGIKAEIAARAAGAYKMAVFLEHPWRGAVVPTLNSVLDAMAVVVSAAVVYGARLRSDRRIEKDITMRVTNERQVKAPTGVQGVDVITGYTADVGAELRGRNYFGMVDGKGLVPTLISPDAKVIDGEGKVHGTHSSMDLGIKGERDPEATVLATTVAFAKAMRNGIVPYREARLPIIGLAAVAVRSLMSDGFGTTSDEKLAAISMSDLDGHVAGAQPGDAVFVHHIVRAGGGRLSAIVKPYLVTEGKTAVLSMDRLVELRIETGRDRRLLARLGGGGMKSEPVVARNRHAIDAPVLFGAKMLRH